MTAKVGNKKGKSPKCGRHLATRGPHYDHYLRLCSSDQQRMLRLNLCAETVVSRSRGNVSRRSSNPAGHVFKSHAFNYRLPHSCGRLGVVNRKALAEKSHSYLFQLKWISTTLIVKVKLSLDLTKYLTMKTYHVLIHHAMKTYGGMEV
jgi:hypothetical protein